jgi:hypothetical protein
MPIAIDKRSYDMPAIQRESVWSTNQIAQLLDISMARHSMSLAVSRPWGSARPRACGKRSDLTANLEEL